MGKLCLSESMYRRIRENLERDHPELEVVRMQTDGTHEGDPRGTTIFCFSVDMTDTQESLLGALEVLSMDSLVWVQAPGAGMEHEMWARLLERGVRLTSAAGVHAEPIAQYVFTYVLNDLRDVAGHRQRQAAGKWEPTVSDDLATKAIGVVGMGGIGTAVARIAKAFGMHVLGLRRGPIKDPDVDERYGPEGLHELLARSDYVVLALPLTATTEGLVGAEALRAMKDTAVLINVARGPVVDEAALVASLRSRSIRAAVLDVFAKEPLEADSPLWGLDNCVVTPHDAGYSPLAGERLGELFVDNLSRFTAGMQLRNEVFEAGPDAAG